MTDVFDPPRSLGRSIRRAIRWSRVALWLEALAAALWPAFAVVCLVLAALVAGLAEGLDATAHRAILIGAGLAVLAALVWGFRTFRLPTRDAAVRRIDDATAGRPLETLSDRLAVGTDTDTARRLWQEHRRRAEQAASAVRAAAPDLRLSTRDRWAMRLFAPVMLVAALIAEWSNAPDRLRSAMEPGAVEAVDPAIALAEPAVDVWAQPPVYTGRDTVYLSDPARGPGPVELPQGSEITVRATGMADAPAFAADLFAEDTALVSLGAGLHEVTGRLASSGRLTVGDPDAPMAAFEIAMIPDEAPEISAPRPPRETMARGLDVAFEASDDYGIVAAWVRIILRDPAEARMEIEPIEFGLPLPINGDPRQVADETVEDLTEHPWAGAEVILTMHAEDGAGQVAVTDPVRLTLPERRFTDPLARSLAEQRRELIIDYGAAERVLDVTQAITAEPEEVFSPHAGAYLGVEIAMRRLATGIVDAQVPDVAPDVAEFLWRAALTLEEGDMASALERLMEAEERLRQALESGTEQEIREALDELRQAMNEYLQELARQALQNPQAQQQQMPQNGQQLSQQDLQEMLDQLQRQAESGLRDQARDMLSQLSQMLQNLQMGQQQPGQSGGQQAMEQLQEMIQRQRQLSDETFDQLRQQRRQGQQGQPGQQGQQQPGQGQQQGQMGQQGQQPGQQGQPGGQGGNRSGRHSENGRLAAEQEALRRAIEELRDQLGGGEGMDGASRALDDAARAMGEARNDLDGERTGEAVQDQMDALDRLNDGAEALAEAMQQNGQGETGVAGMRDGRGRAQDRESIDPFDRPAGSYGTIDGSSTGVPDRSMLDRARELLEELRRRSADQERPEIELRYFERLLERF